MSNKTDGSAIGFLLKKHLKTIFHLPDGRACDLRVSATGAQCPLYIQGQSVSRWSRKGVLVSDSQAHLFS